MHHFATVLLSQIEISEVPSTIDTKPFSTFPTWRERGGGESEACHYWPCERWLHGADWRPEFLGGAGRLRLQ